MRDQITTLEQARAYRYNRWAGDPNGRPYQDGYCVFEVWPDERAPRPHQCNRKNGHGPAGLYCKQHDPEAIATRRRKRKEKWDREMAVKQAKWNMEAAAPKMLSALEQIRDLTERRQLPLTIEINDIAREAIATITQE